MNGVWILVSCLVCFGVSSHGLSGNGTSRPAVVNVGAIFTFDSTIGRVAKIAIQEAVKDVNSNSRTDVVAVIGPQSSVVAHTISHVANELQVPFLSFAATDPTLSSLQFPYFLRTTQSDLYQMTAIAEIVEYYGWKEVIAIFVDDDYGRNGVSALDDTLASRRCRISYKAGISPGATVTRGDIMDVLVKVALMESRVIVLHAYPTIGFMVLSVAHYLGMMGDDYVWISTDWLTGVLDSSSPLPQDTMDTMQGVLVLRQHTPDSENKRAFSSRWNKLTSGLLGLNSYALNAYDTVWLVAHAIDSFFNQGGIISFSNDTKLQSAEGSNLHLEAMSIFDGGPLLLKNLLQSDFVGLTGPFKFSPDKSLIRPAYDIINVIGTGFRRVGYWSNCSGLSILPPETFYSKPPNRSSSSQKLYSVVWPGNNVQKPRGWVFPNNGKQLRIGVPIRVSYREFVSQIQGTNNFKGFCIDVFTAAVNLLPYAVPHQFVPYGNGHENPSYTDMVKLITAGKFDGVVGDIAIVTNRTRIVDFTQPYVASGLVVVAPFQKLNSGGWAFLRPFSAQMWGVITIFFLFVGMVVWILEHRINDEFRGPPKQQLITILWFSLSTLFFAHRENTVSTLGRMVLIIWLFVVLIINSSYTASLTSILTVQQLYSPIKGIESLKETDEPIGFQVGSFAERYLEEIGIPKSRLVALGSPEQYATALQRGPAKGGVAAVVDERPYVELFLSNQCKFRIVVHLGLILYIKDAFLSFLVLKKIGKNGFCIKSCISFGCENKACQKEVAFPRDSPLAVDLSTAILTLSENGDLQRIHDKWLARSACSLDNAELESDRLHLRSFSGLFLICGIACFIALLIYFLQILRKFHRTSNAEVVSDGQTTSRSKRLQTLLSLIDEKADKSNRGSKRRKIDRSISDNIEIDLGRDSRWRERESQVSSQNEVL
ncbi:hypothetical protein RND71_031688 [Anisodus tanguticus]|uniref:Glutamate receptor n=1 Tax=Anisodus tanguticus TaxID=243964 RepID=A0AAE1RD08_9SOLA|nr:hypothetical protein RND71_031688 [Anisodus tanguticus]